MGKQKEETAVAKKEPNAVALPENLQGSWGAEGVDNTDLLVPRILLMQAISEAVAEGKLNQGEIIRSTTNEVLAKKGEGMEFIPLLSFKTWVIMELIGGKYEFRRIEPMTLNNREEPLEWESLGTKWRRDRCLNFYVLLPKDIEREMNALKSLQDGGLPDPDDALIPCVLSFRRTSYGAGKDLATHFKKAEHFRVPPAVTTFKLMSEVQKNDKGTYHIFKLEKAGKTTVSQLEICKQWYDTLQSAKVVIHDPETDSEGAPAAASPEVQANVSTKF